MLRGTTLYASEQSKRYEINITKKIHYFSDFGVRSTPAPQFFIISVSYKPQICLIIIFTKDSNIFSNCTVIVYSLHRYVNIGLTTAMYNLNFIFLEKNLELNISVVHNRLFYFVYSLLFRRFFYCYFTESTDVFKLEFLIFQTPVLQVRFPWCDYHDHRTTIIVEHYLYPYPMEMFCFEWLVLDSLTFIIIWHLLWLVNNKIRNFQINDHHGPFIFWRGWRNSPRKWFWNMYTTIQYVNIFWLNKQIRQHTNIQATCKAVDC